MYRRNDVSGEMCLRQTCQPRGVSPWRLCQCRQGAGMDQESVSLRSARATRWHHQGSDLVNHNRPDAVTSAAHCLGSLRSMPRRSLSISFGHIPCLAPFGAREPSWFLRNNVCKSELHERRYRGHLAQRDSECFLASLCRKSWNASTLMRRTVRQSFA